ncbi:secreted phosphoprotein 24 [Genypterus blacodes]|uniref:secreted phosphoprotein 24 n=1 Tax=Genypterus blacodes TaxID=154954 RepID=UPI003F76C6B0
MKLLVLLWAALQVLLCSGFPLLNPELALMAQKSMDLSLAEVNAVYADTHLYRAMRSSVARVIPLGLNTVDLLMTFCIRETECVKASRRDPQTCPFRGGFFVLTFSCSSRVRVSPSSTQVVSVRCGLGDSFSSSESSEEMFSRHHFSLPQLIRAPPPSAPPGPGQPGRSSLSLGVQVQTRGVTFSNHLD